MTEKSEHIIRREHYVAGREDERERILAILETVHHNNGDETVHNERGFCPACRAIALIEGEDK